MFDFLTYVLQFMLDSEPDPELILDDGDSVKEDAVITGGGELEQNIRRRQRSVGLYTRRSRLS
jgi:hypothetical protein